MTTERGRQFLTLLREATAVLAAILVAFALDAWWEERGARSEALELLRSVDDRMARHVDQIDSVIAIDRAVVEAIRGLGVADPAEMDRMPFEDLVAAYGAFGNFLTLNPELGAVEAMIRGEALAALRSRELRAALSGVPALWQEAMEEGEVVERNGFQAAVLLARQADPALTTAVMLGGAPPDERAIRAILRGTIASPESRAHWIASGGFTLQYVRELETLRTRLTEIRALIADEIAA